MKKYTHISVIMPVCILLGFIFFMVNALKMKPPIVHGILTESFFPVVISGLAILAVLKVLWNAIVNIDESVKEVKKIFNKKFFIIVVVTFLYPFIFEFLGFEISAPIYVFTLALLFDDKIRHVLKKLLLSLGISVFVYVLYAVVFDIRFPRIWG